MIPVRGYDGHKVAVLGLGRTGLSALRALQAGGAETVCWDDNEASRDVASQEGFAVEDLTRDRPWEGVKALIVSPGIAHLYPDPHPVVSQAQAMGVVVDNDIGLFFRSFATEDWDQFDVIPRVVCVTGSNGKSTTTALIHHILTSSGRPCQMGGNIGVPVLDLEPAHDGDVVVLELSSYQTELARALAPEISVFLNRKGFLSEWRRERQVASIDLRNMASLPGLHNHQNACAAYSVARVLGMGARDIETAMASYPGLPHRCQIVGELNGVTFVNDSKATNADAAQKALLAFDNIHWIAGGVPKEGGIEPLLGLMDRVKHAYLIGEASASFSESLGDHPHYVRQIR